MKSGLLLALSCMYSATIVVSISCFDTFHPLVNSVTNGAKNSSRTCKETAATKLYDLLGHLCDDVSDVVTKVQETLSDCVANSEHIDVLQCLRDVTDQNKERLGQIAAKSSEIVARYGQQMKVLKKEEQACLDVVVDESKKKTDQAFSDLMECLQTGYWPASTKTTQGTTLKDEYDDSDSEKLGQRTDPWHKTEPSAIIVPVSIAVACFAILAATCLFRGKCFWRFMGKSNDCGEKEEEHN